MYPRPSKTARQPIKNSIIAMLKLILVLVAAGTIIAQESSTPTAPPDGAAGLTTFADRCANCHGPLGEGDGELAANLSNPPPSFADPDFIRQAVPSDLFDTITNGRVEANMPPFGPSSSNALSEESRWQAVAAIYSLGTTAESINQGQLIYQENCLACHGQSGLGDGDEAAGLSPAPPSLGDLAFWSGNSNQTIFDRLADPSTISFHTYELQEEALWSVVDYIRTFSYSYADPQAASAPLETAVVSGIVTNGTTSEAAPPETAVRLRAVNSDFENTLTMTSTVEAGGRYHFDLTDVPQDWFFRTAVFYNDIEFGSDFNQLTFSQPEIELPVIIYEKTTDPANISINQLHTIFSFANPDEVDVNQLYVVGNAGNTVYAGPTGDLAGGTFELALPSNAQLQGFQRGFGSLDSFFPTDELIPTASGWADTLPVRPGQSTLVLLVHYTLPYQEGTTISHPLIYDTAEINLVVPQGISIASGDNWQDTGLETLENGTFSTYQQRNKPAQSSLAASLEGKPSVPPASSVGPVIRNDTAELLIGGGALLVVIAIAAFALRQWQAPAYPIQEQKADLLQDIADLDDEFQAGQLSLDQYQAERENLMAELKAIWTE
jgi:mono/diheme cytochrome c family protein